MLKHTHLAALQVLFQLARSDRPATSRAVADELGVSRLEAVQLLDELDIMRLADANRIRLTLSGLAVSVARPVVPRLGKNASAQRRHAA